jgi:hypothetical protein
MAGDGPQAPVRAIDCPLDGTPDEVFGVGAQLVCAGEEDGLEQLQHG